jgi:tungstate transport system substrate-binding protein
MIMKRLFAALILLLSAATWAPAQNRLLMIGATTSVEDSGLFSSLLPKFESRTGIKVQVLSRPSSAVLTVAAGGEVDVVIVNSPDALDRFVRAGHAVRRQALMYNDFVIAGPTSDPAGVAGTRDAPGALRAIARVRAAFLSRGDESGTHAAEQRLWSMAEIDPKSRSGGWYREAGMGMGATVEMAARAQAYVLTDRASWIRSCSINTRSPCANQQRMARLPTPSRTGSFPPRARRRSLLSGSMGIRRLYPTPSR